MKNSTSSRSALRSLVLSLSLEEIHSLSAKVYVGCHDGSGHKWWLPIKEAYRHGKRGIAVVSDGINLWTPNELSESECAEIVSAW